MSEKEQEPEQLLLSSSSLGPSVLTKFAIEEQKVEYKIKSSYAKAIQFIHARHFMAELLATFILVVRSSYGWGG